MSDESQQARQAVERAEAETIAISGKQKKTPAVGPIRYNLEAFGVAILGAVLLKWFCIEAFAIPTSSMQPTLMGSFEAGIYDRLLVNKLDPVVREVAIAQAIERGNPSARMLHDRAAVMLSPGVEPAVARRALRKAEAAVSLEGDIANYRTTVGIAHYRLGEYQNALAQLTVARSLAEAKPSGADPIELAFRAMTLHRLGQSEAATVALGASPRASTRSSHARSLSIRSRQTASHVNGFGQ